MQIKTLLASNAFKWFINPFSNKKHFQRFFSFLHLAGLVGMGYGRGSNPETSGEIKVIELVRDYFLRDKKNNKSSIIFDVGANVGGYSKLWLQHADTIKPRIYAFEPSSQAFKQLKTIHNIVPINSGLSSSKGEMTLYMADASSVWASFHNDSLQQISENTSQSASVTTLDLFCKDQKIEHIIFLKLDIEGHEIEVFKGASHMIKSDAIDFIQFEFSQANILSRTFLKDFFDILEPRYSIYRIVKDGIVEIKSYSRRYEIFDTTNYLAVRNDLKASFY